MRRGTIFIILFVLLAAVIIGASTLLQNQPALEITIATDPLAEAWVRDAALAFNQSGATIGVGRRVRVNVIVKSDIAVLNTPWTSSASEPEAWIPAWSSIASIARSTSVTPQTVVGSLARTPLVWMSYDSRSDTIGDISWSGIEAAATGTRVNLAFSLPTSSVQGLAALISGAADYHQSGVLTDAMLSSAPMRAWLAPVVQSVPNFNTVGANVAQFVAGPQGSTVDAAIAPESQWLLAMGTLSRRGTPRFAYPQNPVVFDFPFLILRDSFMTDEHVSAAQAFAAYLAGSDQQGELGRYGLRPAQGDPQPESAPFADAQRFGIEMSLPASQSVQLPSSSSINALYLWFNTITRSR